MEPAHSWDIHVAGIRIVVMLLICMMLPTLSWWSYIILWIAFGVHVIIGKKHQQHSMMVKQQANQQKLAIELSKFKDNIKDFLNKDEDKDKDKDE